jgi:tetratricopeptide (TPR) repeat protein
MRALILAVGLFLTVLAGSAESQRYETLAVADAETVARGLEAQYQAALIRERRLADERELRLITDYEGRLLRARAEYDRGVAGAREALAQARADYAGLVQQIVLRDAASRAEVATYRAEVQGLAAQATPERLAALERFADGDRVGAWPVLEALRVAEDRAIEQASNLRRAVRWRQDAELRNIMRLNGEATTEQVLLIWEQAAALDPQDFWTHIYSGRLYIELGRLANGWDAFSRALQVAQDDLSRITAIIDLGDAAWAGGQWDLARRAYSDALTLIRPHVSNPNSTSLIAIIMDRLSSSILTDDQYTLLRMRIFLDIAARRGVRPDRVQAVTSALPAVELPAPEILTSAEQTLRLILQMEEARATAHPTNQDVQRALSVALNHLANLYLFTSRYAEAEELLRHAMQIDRATAAASSPEAVGLSVTLQLLGDLLVAQQRFREAERLYREGLDLDRRAQATDPGNQDRVRNVAVMLQRIGAIRFLQRDLPGARRAWAEAADTMRALALAAPHNASLRADVQASDALLSLAEEH